MAREQIKADVWTAMRRKDITERATAWLKATRSLSKARGQSGDVQTEALRWLEEVERLQADNSRLVSSLMEARDRLSRIRRETE